MLITPALSFTPTYVQSLVSLIRETDSLGIELSFMTHAGSHIGQLREYLATQMRQKNTGYDVMLWIDSDISFSALSVVKLLCSPHSITSGIYLISQEGQTSLVVNGKYVLASDLSKLPKYISVDACGFGFLAIKQGVFESMDYPYFANAIDENGNWIETGEDASWCIKAKKQGFNIACDTTATVGHFKSTIWEIK